MNPMAIAADSTDRNVLSHIIRSRRTIKPHNYSDKPVRKEFIEEMTSKPIPLKILDEYYGKNIIPIDMLRLKLSFFGALKFDPRSDKWLRICMFQGAPLPHELKNYDEQWVYKTSI